MSVVEYILKPDLKLKNFKIVFFLNTCLGKIIYSFTVINQTTFVRGQGKPKTVAWGTIAV